MFQEYQLKVILLILGKYVRKNISLSRLYYFDQLFLFDVAAKSTLVANLHDLAFSAEPSIYSPHFLWHPVGIVRLSLRY